MRLLELNNSGTKSARALTIGNFDGVHLGHRAILDRLVSVALKKNLIPSVLTFQPHPAEFFAREKAPVRLYGNREKLNSFSEAGVAQAILLPFNIFVNLNCNIIVTIQIQVISIEIENG